MVMVDRLLGLPCLTNFGQSGHGSAGRNKSSEFRPKWPIVSADNVYEHQPFSAKVALVKVTLVRLVAQYSSSGTIPDLSALLCIGIVDVPC